MRSITILKLVVFCIAMLTMRLLKTEHFSFFFLLWNLLLASLPYWMISRYYKLKTSKGRFAIIAGTLLFLPNAPYLLTDLFHLTKNLVAPMWFDLVLILSFSILGLLLFIITAEKLFTILSTFFKSRAAFSCVKFLIILSNGYGIYLGRYLRFNSWDVISNPDDLALRMYQSVFDRNNYKETLAITITFAIFLYLVFEIYESFKKRVEEKQNELF